MTGRQQVTGPGTASLEPRHRSGRGARGVGAAIGTAGRREHEGPVHGRAGASGAGAFAGSSPSRLTFANESKSRRWAEEETWLPQLARAGTPLASAA
jgi:hypothetical protein